MGIFWSYPDQPKPEPSVMQHFRAALAAPPPSDADLDEQARELAGALALAPPRQAAKVNGGSLIIAIVIVAALVGAGIGTNAAGLDAATTALFSLGTTAFGIVVGLLTGEKPSQ
jgi:hypothetical protein